MVSPGTNKEPWFATVLSLWIPGLGHIYLTKTPVGALLLLFSIGSLGLALTLFFQPKGNVSIALILLLIFVLLQISIPFLAFFGARKGNSPEFETERRKVKDPWLAVFLSLLLPGLGHLYLRKWLVGIGVMLGTLGCFAFLGALEGELPSTIAIIFLAEAQGFLLPAMVAYWTYWAAPVRRETTQRSIFALLAVFFVCGAFLHTGRRVVRLHLAEPFYVTGRSMSPVLNAGDRMLIKKMALDDLDPGIIVAYENPQAEGSVQLGRIVAVGPATVRVDYSQECVFVDGKRLNEGPFANIAYLPRFPSEESGEWVLKPSEIFLLSDNSAIAKDGRSYGPTSRSLVRGIVYKIWWPLDRARPIE